MACVVGEIDILRALAVAGIPCAAVAHRGDSTRFSRATRARVDLPTPWTLDQLVETLMAWGSAQPQRPVLFYDGDWHLVALSQHRELLSRAFRFVIPDHELVMDLVDKERFLALTARCELPVPRAAALAPGEALGTEMNFPAVVKPLTREHDTWKPLSLQKAIQVDTPSQLQRLLDRIEPSGISVIVQEMVPGPETLIESYHAYIDAAGRTVGAFTGAKIRTFPLEHGYSTSLVTTAADDVDRLGRDILERIGFRNGVAKLDFKRHPADGSLALLEINPRFNLWHYLGAKAGVNLAAAVYADLTGAARAPLGTARAGVRWCNLPSDLRAARAAGLPLRRWAPWALRCEAKHAIAWDDPLPFLAEVAKRLRTKIRATTAARSQPRP